MTSTMNYKGYYAQIEYDADDEIFFGRLAGIRDGVSFHGYTVTELKTAFQESVDEYIKTCAKIGKNPQKPFSGKVMFRINPETHRKASLAAELNGISLNQWAERALKQVASESQIS